MSDTQTPRHHKIMYNVQKITQFEEHKALTKCRHLQRNKHLQLNQAYNIKHTHTHVRASRKSHNMEFIVSCTCFPIENVMKIKYMIGKYVNYLNNLRYTLFPIVCLGDTTCDVVCNDNLICQQISFSILGFKVRVI